MGISCIFADDLKEISDFDINAFLALVRAGLWEEEVRLLSFEKVEWARLYGLAQEQSVVGLVAAGLEHVVDLKVPRDVALAFAGDTLFLEHRNKEMNAFVAELMGRLRAAGVEALLVKGQGIAQCYERPFWRASGDVDLLLDAAGYRRAVDFLSGLAQEVEREDVNRKHWCCEIYGWEVECHGTLRSGLWRSLDRGIDAVQADTFANDSVRVWRNGATDVYVPSADNDVVFVFCHILQHLFKSGVGLRQICDWCRLLWTFRGSLDGGLLLRRLRSMGALSEWRAFAAFAVDFLGMPIDAMPLYSPSARWLRKASRIWRLVLRTGNMGHNQDMSYRKTRWVLVRRMISFWRITCHSARCFAVSPKGAVCSWWELVHLGVSAAIGLRG